MTRILVENLNGLDLGGITTHIFNYISVLQRSSDYKIDIVVTVQENNDVIDKFKSLGCALPILYFVSICNYLQNDTDILQEKKRFILLKFVPLRPRNFTSGIFVRRFNLFV